MAWLINAFNAALQADWYEFVKGKGTELLIEVQIDQNKATGQDQCTVAKHLWDAQTSRLCEDEEPSN